MTLQDLIESAIAHPNRNFDIYSDTANGCFLLDSEASVDPEEGFEFFADALYVRQYFEDNPTGAIGLLLDEINDVAFSS